jgi:arylsulfatase A-like enzyme
MKPPNILFILADDMGYGDFSCFNHGASETPHLDALLQESVCLTQHYSASPLCAPARAALLTGRYPQRTGVIDTICLSRRDCLGLNEMTLADMLRGKGYRTGCVGKWHLGSVESKFHPNARGFDEFVGFRAGWHHYYDYRLDYNGALKQGDGTYMTDVFTGQAVDFIQRNRNQPFFLHLAYNAPHAPLEVPEEDWKPFRERGAFNEGVSRLYGMIRRMDRGIGQVMEALEREGLRDNTIVVFTSDNGPQFGGEGDLRLNRFNCGFRGCKGSVHEGGIRIPLLIRWPDGLDGGRHYHDLVHFVDWLPTLLEATGTDVPGSVALDGQSILSALRGEGASHLPRQRFWQWSRAQPVATHNAAMRDGDWKLVRPGDQLANDMSTSGWQRDLELYHEVDFYPERFANGVPEAQGSPPCLNQPAEPPMLFNLAADPLELNDLSVQFPERVSRMEQALDCWFESVERDRANVIK